MKKKKGFFVTVEGLEGSGKSSVIVFLEKYLKKQKLLVKVFRDPGSTKTGEMIRDILLANKSKVSAQTELLLYLAARSQLIEEKLLAAFKKYDVVICDRFYDSTIAYQGYGLGLGKLAEEGALLFNRGVVPDLTLLLESDVKRSLNRIKNKDRIESRPFVFHNKLKKGFAALACKNKDRIKVIPADSNLDEIYKHVSLSVDKYLKKWKLIKR